jgi:hypothetical protein
MCPQLHLVDQAGDLDRRVRFCGESAQRVPELAHYRSGVQRVPLDVADRDQDPVPPGQRLVEVPADLGLIAGRQVAERHRKVRYRGQRRGQEAALQSQGHQVVFRRRAQGFDAERHRLRELAEDLHVLPAGQARAVDRDHRRRLTALDPRGGDAHVHPQRAVGH